MIACALLGPLSGAHSILSYWVFTVLFSYIILLHELEKAGRPPVQTSLAACGQKQAAGEVFYLLSARLMLR